MNKHRVPSLIAALLIICISIMYAATNNKNQRKENQIPTPLEHVVIASEVGEDDINLEEDQDIAIDEFDIKEKQKNVRSLVQRATDFCMNNKLATICHAFTHTKRFIEGELYIFLLDTKGRIYAHGEQEDLLWKNLWDYRDSFGALAIQSIIKTAQAGPNWLTYEWSGAVKVSFVQKVIIDNKEYVIGCGYYPHSKKYAAIGLVKGAVSLFNQTVNSGRPIEEAFSTMGYPLSERFLYGDLYLYALDFNGTIRTQGEDPELIGINALNRKDAKGKQINKEMIERLKRKKEGEGIWIEYTSKNAVKYTYAEKVKDAKDNYYFIACGYYPEIDRDKTIDLVRRGYQFMKASGTSVAAKEFTDKNINTFRYGDLYLFVYDLKGKCIAHGGNSALVGNNQFNDRDQDGAYLIREFIDQAKIGNGWVDSKVNNAFRATYVEKIDMGVDSYIIGAGMYPVAKPETMTLLVKSAVGYVQTHTDDESFEAFSEHKGEFIRGDLSIFVFDLEGYCYAWGDDPELIWKNLMNWKDDEGKPFIKLMIEGSMQGAGHFVHTFNKKMRVNYVEPVEKENKKYIIGSGFYK